MLSSSYSVMVRQLLMTVLCLFLLPLQTSSQINSHTCLQEERTTLLQLKSGFTNYKNTSSIKSWIPNTDCCEWDGVTCDPSTGHVIEIGLFQQQLKGHLPTNLNPSTLPMLSDLNLSFNNITGIIPSWLFELLSLTSLDLSTNLFTGFDESITFPIVSPIQQFRAYENKLQGPIPMSIIEIKSLQLLYLQDNHLNGTILFTQIQNLQNLTYLDLSHNNLSLVDDTHHNNTSAAAQVAAASWPQFVSLWLVSCNLGEFPTTLLQSQSNFVLLSLSSNGIQGEVPEWLLNVSRNTLQYLFLANNKLTGELSSLPWPNLENFDIRSNMFVGNIPLLPPNIRNFWGSVNHFSGKIPTSMCNLSYIVELHLSSNNLTGNLPLCLRKIVGNNLELLDLMENKIDGIISPEIFEQCESLKTLRLNTNQFVGSIPKSVANCSHLQILDFGNNQLNDTFPYWLDTLPDLQILILSSNKLYGSLLTSPKTTSSFSNLRILHLSNNHLLGNLSSNFLLRLTAMIDLKGGGVESHLSTTYTTDSLMTSVKGAERVLKRIPYNLVSIDLSNNQLQGRIPNAIGHLILLKWLNLSYNDLVGSIPSSLGNLTQLESLDLSSNHLQGKIPNDLVKLNFLSSFNVSENNLVGPVPTADQFTSFTDESYKGNKGLCGPFLEMKCGKSQANYPPPPLMDKEEDSLSSWGKWESYIIGCGCGTVIGLVVGHFLFIKKNPMWLQRFMVLSECFLIKLRGERPTNLSSNQIASR